MSRQLWERLVDPPPTVLEPDERRQGRLLAALLVAVIGLGALSQAVQLALVPGYLPTFVAIAVALLALVVAYALVRRGRTLAAARVLTLTITIASLVSAAVGPASGVSLAFVFLGPLVATLLLRFGDALVVVAIAVLGVAALFALRLAPAELGSGTLSFMVLGSVVALLGRRHRDGLEADRKAKLVEREAHLRTLLEEKQRADAQLRLVDRLKSLGTLTAGVAHELNNPMTFVSLSLELAQQSVEDGSLEGARAALVDMAEGVTRMTGIVRGLQTFARGEEDVIESVNVTEVVESTLRMASAALEDRAKVVRDLDPHVPLVRANAGKLAQVILNLLINAAQAIPDADPEAEIGVRVATKDGLVIVSVRDTGAGIAPEHRARVFDPFFTTKSVGQGMGLGLAICHGIITSFGGTIRIESELGMGTTFHVELPIAA
jgi:C4-dicarboxylate-specific signal transduction histidine kinase